MPDITVSATRSARELERVPGNVTVITRQEIEETKPNTITEVLKGLPGIFVQDLNGTGTQALIDMRGFGATAGSHVLVTIDGRRQNLLDQNHIDFTTIPVDNVERIEILHGPAGVLYGDTAVGGVINIVTRDGQGQPGGRLETRAGSYGLWGGRGLFQGAEDRFSWVLTARQDSSDGFRENSETRQESATFKTRYQASDSLGLLVDGDLARSNFSIPGPLSKEQFESDPRRSYTQNKWYERSNASLRTQAAKDWGQAGTLTCDLSWRDWRSDSVYYTYLQAQSQAWGLQPKYVLDGSLAGLNHRLTAGVDWFLWDGRYDFSDIGGPKVIEDDFKLSSLGLYLLEEISLTPKLHLEVGARQHWHDYDLEARPVGSANQSWTIRDQAQAWSTGLTYNLTKGAKVFARVGQSFRFPLVDEYLGTYSGTFTDLKPERAVSYDLGGQWSFMPGGEVSLTAYHMTMTDEIAYDEVTYANRNLDDTEHQGLEGALQYPLSKRLTLLGGLTWQRARFSGGPHEGCDIPLVPVWMGSLGARWEPLQDLRLTLRVRQVGQRYPGDDFANQQEKLDSFTTVDLSASYKLGRFDFFLSVSNLFSERYSTLAYYSSWSGRTNYNPEPEALVWGGVGMSF